MKQPMQPIVMDVRGVIRFQQNKLVRYLLDEGGLSTIDLAKIPVSRADRMQFAQLIGYSISGFGELNYAKKKIVAKANRIAAKMASRLEKGGE